MSEENIPSEWPGKIWLEGRTLTQVPDVEGQGEFRAGPGGKKGTPVFHNSAMAPNRTRSVMLLSYALSNKWFNPKEINVLEGLGASGLRGRRWINEISPELLEGVNITVNDFNPEATSWAQHSHLLHPSNNATNSKIEFVTGDFRRIVLDKKWHWIDIDPFGSPIPFLDSALQSLARTAVLEVSATDTAALCGSSPTAAKRKYGIIAVVDKAAHDTAIRVLLGQIAIIAARHSKVIEPLISIFDDHHVRVSVLVKESPSRASNVYENIGWRINSPVESELEISISSSLHPHGCPNMKQKRCLVPWNKPPNEISRNRVSGPLWSGTLGNTEVLKSMNRENAVELCGLNIDVNERDMDSVEKAGFDESMIKIANRQIEKSMFRFSDEAEVIDCPGLIMIDELPTLCGINGPPSPSKLVTLLQSKGHRAGLSSMQKPAIRTNAPWNIIVESAKEILEKSTIDSDELDG